MGIASVNKTKREHKKSETLCCTNQSCGREAKDENGISYISFPPLSRQDVFLVLEESPNQKIAIVDRCDYCGTLYRVWMSASHMEKYDYTQDQLLRAIKKCRLLSFSLSEINNGVTDIIMPERAITFATGLKLIPLIEGYNPNAHIEPRNEQEDLL